MLFLSGIGSLIFETLWLRLSGLAFGNSICAAALILSSFMAGLAVGNALAGLLTILRWGALHFFAVVGVVGGLFGLFIVFVLLVGGEGFGAVWVRVWHFW